MTADHTMVAGNTMTAGSARYAVIGGGFYGCAIAVFLAERGGAVTLLEARDDLLLRASYTNQARLHGGYHYPRSFNTAYRSRLNFRRFIEDYGPAIDDSFVMLYAVARVRSHINGRQFRDFCRNIEAPLLEARAEYAALFNPRLIEAVFETEEYAFNVGELRRLLRERLAGAGVRVMTGQRVASIANEPDSVVLHTDQGLSVAANQVFNCTYSGLNRIARSGRSHFRLKHEITEIVLVEPPPELKGLGVTVMDGPFFSFMPFPERNLYSFTHVRYTPHAEIKDDLDSDADPYQVLADYPMETRFGAMRRDAARYMEAVDGFLFRDSLFEVKTVMIKNEVDDGRPILFSTDADPRVVSILGSKIDNIYDALVAIENHIVEHAQ